MTEEEIQAAGERLAWETEAMLSGVWVLLYGGNRAVLAVDYEYAKHGALSHCWHCKRPTGGCSWIQSPTETGWPGDCCDRCQHGSVTK